MTDTKSLAKKKTAVIFDFDGTIVDVMEVFVMIANELASGYGYEPIRPEEIATLRNRSARELLRTRIPIPFWRLWSFTRRAKARYRELIEHVHLIPGMNEVIATLHTRGYRIGILSSNSTETITELLGRFALSVDFIATCSTFGKAQALRTLLSGQHLAPTDAIYVGDEVRDIEACRTADLDILSVTWGLNSPESLRSAGGLAIDQPKELLKRLPVLE